MQTVTSQHYSLLFASTKTPLTRKTAKFILICLVSYAILFMAMTLRPNIYDEGLVLTAAMRVAAGQLPHRDFYAIYGPAQFYILAGLFRLFGQSILVERLFDLFLRALTIATVYTIALQYVRKSIAGFTATATLLWLIGLISEIPGNALFAVGLINLISTSLLIPIFTNPFSRRRMFIIGAIAAAGSLFRYDTGIALFGIHTIIIAAAIRTRLQDRKLFAFAAAFWPYMVGFAAIVLPPLFYFLSLSSIHPLLHDIIIYPSTYYHRARNLPFPIIGPDSLDDFAIYVPIPIIFISLFFSLDVVVPGMRSLHTLASHERGRRLNGFLFGFALLSSAMYLKGLVRISPTHIYLATIPSLLLVAILFQRRFSFRPALRIVISSLAFLSLLSPACSTLRELQSLQEYRSSISQELWSFFRGTARPLTKVWCNTASPATRGLCFLPDDKDIQAAEFIDAHTRPNDKLYVGLRKHDRIFANDNLLYFAAARLPATRWSHFDPDLQNRADIQKQMIGDLEFTTPPYLVLDSEFDRVHEPNDSSRSSGVVLLDNYIREKYKPVQTFGQLSIWRRLRSS